jgi:hypothetical protein
MRLSVSSIRINRPRPAPSDSRTAISWRRALAFESESIVTLVHASSSTSVSDPMINGPSHSS